MIMFYCLHLNCKSIYIHFYIYIYIKSKAIIYYMYLQLLWLKHKGPTVATCKWWALNQELSGYKSSTYKATIGAHLIINLLILLAIDS